MSKKNKTELKIKAIENGTVIDHITANKALHILKILGLPDSETKNVTIAMNVSSKEIGRKDILKIENRELDHKELNQIALIAPKATINIIRKFEPVKKDNLDSNISYSSAPISPLVEQSDVVVPLVSEYPEAISDSDLEPVVLYSAEKESWDDAHTDFTFEEESATFESSADEDDFDVEYEGESELDEMDEVLLVEKLSKVFGLVSLSVAVELDTSKL